MDANPIECHASDGPEIETGLVRRDMRHDIQMELTSLARSRVPAGAAHLKRYADSIWPRTIEGRDSMQQSRQSAFLAANAIAHPKGRGYLVNGVLAVFMLVVFVILAVALGDEIHLQVRRAADSEL